MLLGIILGLSVALMISSGVFIGVGIAKGFMPAAFTGAVIGGTGQISYAIIIFIFSCIITVFIATVIKDHNHMKNQSNY